LRHATKTVTISGMSEPENLPPETEPLAEELDEVEELGGDAEIMESLPDEGSPLTTETEYDALEESGGLLDDEASDYPPQDYGGPYDDSDALLEVEVEQYQRYDPESMQVAEQFDPYTGFVDIDAALASVSALGYVEPEPEPEPEELNRAELRETRAELQAARAAQLEREAVEAEQEKERPLRPIEAPAVFGLRRGQMASVVPAVALILVGAWLTFATTAPSTVTANPVAVAAVVGGAVVLTMIAQWLSAGRWSRGVFFFAVLALMIAGIIYYQTTNATSFALLGPLVLLAVGVAFGLTGLLARPADRRLLLPGLLFLVAGGVTMAFALGVVPSALIAGAAPFWPVLVAVLAVLWLLPVVIKRRG
jgi:hypothetical protein